MSTVDPNESNAFLVTIPGIVFCIVAPIFVAIRFWSRIRLQNALGADDWTILGSLVRMKSWAFATAETIMLMLHRYFLCLCRYFVLKVNSKSIRQNVSVWHVCSRRLWLRKTYDNAGNGRQKDGTQSKALDMRISNISTLILSQLFYVAQIFYKININMTKASILLLYLRIFIIKPFRVVCWVMLGIILSYMTASVFVSIFQCAPLPRAWDKSIPGTCISITMNWYANAGFSIATDVIILLMPMPIIYSLRLQRNQKVGLMVVFALGILWVFIYCGTPDLCSNMILKASLSRALYVWLR